MPQLRAQTTALPRIPVLGELFTARRGQLAWVRGEEGIVAAGEAARFDLSAEKSTPANRGRRFAVASDWWSQLQEETELRDDVRVPGSGLVCLGSFSFFPDSPAGSSLIVPQVVVGISEGRGFLTIIGPTDRDVFDTLDDDAQALLDAVLRGETSEPQSHGAFRADDLHDEETYYAALAAMQDRMKDGLVSKVVLARELEISTENQIDERLLVSRLHAAYPNCWTFAVDGLLGATPELLASTSGDSVKCRVLAGTLPQGKGSANDLLASDKDRLEHKLAVDSVVGVLEKLGDVTVSEPYVLDLPNVLHLATDVTATLKFGANALQIAGALHPTAALGGTPTLEALEVIADVEGIDRDRYGAPVGWLGTGNVGEWGIALRCAKVDGDTHARAWAGGGILADSDPATERAETDAKFAPILGAFEPRQR